MAMLTSLLRNNPFFFIQHPLFFRCLVFLFFFARHLFLCLDVGGEFLFFAIMRTFVRSVFSVVSNLTLAEVKIILILVVVFVLVVLGDYNAYDGDVIHLFEVAAPFYVLVVEEFSHIVGVVHL